MGKSQKKPCPILQVIHKSEKTVGTVDRRMGQVDIGNTAVRAVAGTNAFRDYNWLTDVVATNKSGDLRGMVVSAKARTVFRFFSEDSKYMEYMQNIGLVAGFAAGIVEASNQLERMAKSNDAAFLKGAKLATIAGTAAQRALLGAVPAGTHLIYKSLEGWCMLAGLAGGKIQAGANQCIGTLKNADKLVESTFKAVTDTTNQANFVYGAINVAGTAAKAARDEWIVIDTFISSPNRR